MTHPPPLSAQNPHHSRKIIHCDCDCFYAAVEMRDDASLRGLPVAVGGSPERRGVIATCNYEARRFGVHSAMPSFKAQQLCPGLVILPPRMEYYRGVSKQIRQIFQRYSDRIEPLSLDEAFLDVTGSSRHQGSATRIASELRDTIAREVGITVSAGIAPNKFLAKIASDINKPNGQYVIAPAEVDAFLTGLPVKKLFGVGKVTASKLERLGFSTCGDLRDAELSFLHDHFGVFGERLYQLCRGIDERPVKTSRVRKSLSAESTFNQDLPHLAACSARLHDMLTGFMKDLERLDEDARKALHKCFVKVKFNDFGQTTAECLCRKPEPAVFQALLEEAFMRGNKPVRLLGVGVRFAPQDGSQGLQLELFDTQAAPVSPEGQRQPASD